MRRALILLAFLLGPLLALPVALAGPAAAGPSDIVRWDMSTCATEGAASPVIVFENEGPRGFGYEYYIDGEKYTVVIAPPGTAEEYTLPPVRAGEHYLQLTRDVTPPGDEIPKAYFTAPECPAGSPPPSANVYPKADPVEPPAATADFGEPYCTTDEPRTSVLPWSWRNASGEDGEGSAVGDDETVLYAWGTGASTIEMSPGQHTYRIVSDSRTLATLVAEPLDCSTPSPEPTEPETPSPTPTAPTTPTTPAEDDSTSPAAEPAATGRPEVPRVVQTDGVGAA